MKRLFLLLLLGAPAIASAEFVVIDNTPAQSSGAAQAYAPAPMYANHSAQTYAAAQAYVQAANVAQPATPSPVVPAAVPNVARDRLVQFINQAVGSGQMEAAVALKLMRALLDSEGMHTGPQATSYQEPKAGRGGGLQLISAKPQMQVAPSEIVAATPTVVPAPASRWVLDTKLTLRENLDAWAKIAGWNPSSWEASNFYQVTASSTVEGDFPAVLKQIADSTGLNICAKSREKVVRVTDASVSCK